MGDFFFHNMRQNKEVLPKPLIMSGKTEIMVLLSMGVTVSRNLPVDIQSSPNSII
jgi:hypothetical protein